MAVKRGAAEFTAEEIAEVQSPELTDEELASLRPGSEALPPKLFAALTARKPGQRGPQKSPTKKMVTLRLDPVVLEGYRASGDGWQRRINAVLKAGLEAGIKDIGAGNALKAKMATGRRAAVKKAPAKKRA
jgi:uncharacterized protein (DUF4415 family)